MELDRVPVRYRIISSDRSMIAGGSCWATAHSAGPKSSTMPTALLAPMVTFTLVPSGQYGLAIVWYDIGLPDAVWGSQNDVPVEIPPGSAAFFAAFSCASSDCS